MAENDFDDHKETTRTARSRLKSSKVQRQKKEGHTFAMIIFNFKL